MLTKDRSKSTDNKVKTFFTGGLKLFGEAYENTKRQMLTSVVILIVITLIVALLMWWAEYEKNPEFGYVDALVWNFVKYVGDPAEVGKPPITGLGKFMGTLVGVLGIAIFAVPAGLIGSGLIDAMNDEKREKELQELRKRIRKAFLRDSNKALNNYLREHSEDDCWELGKEDLYFVPQEIPVYKMQARQNMDLKDIIDCCKKFPEIRLKNVAQAKAEADARFVVEYVPLTDAKYGCFIDRGSKVTIVSTSSYAEKGTGWFTYYLAMLGGFNYLSKDLEVDYDDQDPYFNMNSEPMHDMKKRNDHEKKSKAIDKIKEKQRYRDAFFHDLTSCCQGEDSWVIIMKHHLKSKVDSYDFHFNCSKKGGKECTVTDLANFEQLTTDFARMMEQEFNMTTACSSDLYALKHNERLKNVAYFIREKKPNVNVLVLRPASDVMNMDERKLVIAYRMARLISQRLDNSRGPLPDDVADLHRLDFAFTKETKGTRK